jgi:hypothetical protein
MAWIIATTLCLSTAVAGVARVLVHGERTTRVADFYTQHGHVAGVTTALSERALKDVDLVWSVLPDAHFAPREIAALSALLARGGCVAFVGEQGRHKYRQNNRISAAISALGGSMSIVNHLRDPAFRTATTGDGQIRSHPLTAGINVFRYAAFAPILPGRADVIMTGEQPPNPSAVFMAAEAIGAGRIFLVTDQNIWDEVSDTANNDNAKLFLNLLRLTTTQ